MPRKKQYKVRTLYFPKRLKRQLNKIREYPMTLVEAPSGYGKTTALRSFFDREELSGMPVYWLTFLGESLSVIWEEFCRIISRFDPEQGEVLAALGAPGEDDLLQISRILEKLQCSAETYIVLDNFGDIPFGDQKGLLAALGRHGGKGLHIIVVKTQVTEKGYWITGGNHLTGHLTHEDFAFEEKDIAAYFKQVGMQLTEEQISAVAKNTEGWIFAIYLQMLAFLETGDLARGDMNALIRQSLWSKLSLREQAFFLAISIVPQITTQQAQFMAGENQPFTEKLLRGNGFIRYDNYTHSFYPHAIFFEFLKKRFEQLPKEEKQRIWARGGQWAERVGNRLNTLKFYYAAGEYERIFSMVMSSYEIADILDDITGPMVMDLLENTPWEVKVRHPQAMIPLAFTLFFMGNNEELLRRNAEIETIITESDLIEGEKNALRGEMELLLSFLEYNRIEDMSLRHRRALELLGGPANLINVKSTWTFGSPSVLYMWWREKGSLSKELDRMDECMPVYYKLTEGHGSGAEIIMRAEAEFMKGNPDNAEILCHKALFVSDSKRQNSIYLCGLFLLARIAVMRGDEEQLRSLMEIIEQRAQQNTEDLCRYTLDLIRGFLGVTTAQGDWVPDWLAYGEFKNRLVIMTVPFGHMIYGRALLNRKEYRKLIGTAENFMGVASIFPNLLPQVYSLIHMAIANEGLGRHDLADDLLVQAMELALPDQVYIPFVENEQALSSLLSRTAFSGREGLAKIETLSKKFGPGLRKLAGPAALLTPREKEVALLAKERLSAKEIAAKLYISESTVNNTLARVYEKLEIHSRSELASTRL